MRKILVVLSALLIGAALIAEHAEAARVGGGRSLGAQRSAPRTPPASTPAKPQQQPQQAQPQQGQPAPAAQPQPSFMQKWGPLLGGLALGGLLGSLFGGSGFGGVLLLVVLALAAFVVVGALMRRRSEAPRPMQYAGFQERGLPPQAPARTDPQPLAAQAPVGSLPAGFDAAAFLRAAKLNFMRLQAANDAGNVEDIRELVTDGLFESLAEDVRSRGGRRQQTDVEGLEAELLELATEGGEHWASVRFTGRIRETAGALPEPFEETWNLVKPADGSRGWLLAGIQQPA